MPCPQTNDVECRICHQMMSWDEDYVRVSYELAPPIGGPAHAQCVERAQTEKERRLAPSLARRTVDPHDPDGGEDDVHCPNGGRFIR